MARTKRTPRMPHYGTPDNRPLATVYTLPEYTETPFSAGFPSAAKSTPGNRVTDTPPTSPIMAADKDARRESRTMHDSACVSAHLTTDATSNKATHGAKETAAPRAAPRPYLDVSADAPLPSSELNEVSSALDKSDKENVRPASASKSKKNTKRAKKRSAKDADLSDHNSDSEIDAPATRRVATATKKTRSSRGKKSTGEPKLFIKLRNFNANRSPCPSPESAIETRKATNPPRKKQRVRGPTGDVDNDADDESGADEDVEMTDAEPIKEEDRDSDVELAHEVPVHQLSADAGNVSQPDHATEATVAGTVSHNIQLGESSEHAGTSASNVGNISNKATVDGIVTTNDNVATNGNTNISGNANSGSTTTPSGNSTTNSNGINLVLPEMKRSLRFVDPNDPVDAALIAQAKKAPKYIYDSDAEVRDGPVKGNIKNADKYVNVRWGDYCYDDTSTEFQPTEPFTSFVPGRWERMPDGTIRDQKYKLVIKVLDKDGNRKIYRNPPPKDWNDQEAISALNKRTVQQVRRTTNTRFRPKVVPYVEAERKWILTQLNKDTGKPKYGWNSFVEDFNKQFAGKVIEGADEPRPARTNSSLTKEVDRFSNLYSKGEIPQSKASPKGKTGGKRKATDDGDANAGQTEAS